MFTAVLSNEQNFNENIQNYTYSYYVGESEPPMIAAMIQNGKCMETVQYTLKININK